MSDGEKVKPQEIRSAFAADAAESFRFLESEFGYRMYEADVSPPDVWVTWRKGNLRVMVDLEFGSDIAVIFQRVSRIPFRGFRIGLQHMLDALAPGVRVPSCRVETYRSEDIRRLLDENAELLHAHCGPVLVGDFTGLDR